MLSENDTNSSDVRTFVVDHIVIWFCRKPVKKSEMARRTSADLFHSTTHDTRKSRLRTRIEMKTGRTTVDGRWARLSDGDIIRWLAD